jgi:hypothetical protein
MRYPATVLNDMEYHNHVTLFWPRSSSVELQDEYLVCVLDWRRKYDLADIRAQRHLRFLNLKTDEDLVEFVRAWGPLWLAEFEGKPLGSLPRSWYWTFRERLRAQLRLIHSLKSDDKARLRTALLDYIVAKDGGSSTVKPTTFTASTLGSIFASGPEVRPEDWIPAASVARLRQAASWCVSTFCRLESMLCTAWPKGKPEFVWMPQVRSLADAIEWDLSNSIAGARPLVICEDCRTVFQPDSAHPRKFCSELCAHRVAMRMWRKNNAQGKANRKRGKHAKAKKA